MTPVHQRSKRPEFFDERWEAWYSVAAFALGVLLGGWLL